MARSSLRGGTDSCARVGVKQPIKGKQWGLRGRERSFSSGNGCHSPRLLLGPKKTVGVAQWYINGGADWLPESP